MKVGRNGNINSCGKLAWVKLPGLFLSLQAGDRLNFNIGTKTNRILYLLREFLNVNCCLKYNNPYKNLWFNSGTMGNKIQQRHFYTPLYLYYTFFINTLLFLRLCAEILHRPLCVSWRCCPRQRPPPAWSAPLAPGSRIRSQSGTPADTHRPGYCASQL